MPRIFLIKPRNKQQKKQIPTTNRESDSDVEDCTKVDLSSTEKEAAFDMDKNPEENKTPEEINEKADNVERKRNSIDSSTSDDIIPSDTSSIQGKVCFGHIFFFDEIFFPGEGGQCVVTNSLIV